MRLFLKAPAFAMVAVLTLALGVGANTAMFSVINSVLLRPLPYPESSRLVRLARGGTQEGITMAEFQFCREHSQAFASLAGYRDLGERQLVYRGNPEWIKVLAVSSDFLKVLQVRPAIGRDFVAEESRTGAPRAMLLTYRTWQNAFGGDPEVIGRAVNLDNSPYIVAGILPESFWYPQGFDVFSTLQSTGGVDDSGSNTSVIGRLKPGFSLQQAGAEATSLAQAFRHQYPALSSAANRDLAVVPYQEWLVGNVKLNLILLFATTAFLFLMVCSNLASLMLARLAAREKEIALRLALGSTGTRLFRQFLAENLVLSGTGIAIGIAIGQALLAALLSMLPFQLPRSVPVRLDSSVLFFSAGLFVFTALVLTLIPVFNTGRINVYEALKAVGQVAAAGGGRRRVRDVLVVGQIAVSAVLLITAGLLIQSLYHLRQEHLGFATQGLITFETPLPSARYSTTQSVWRLYDQVSERLLNLPSVRTVAAANLLPLTGGLNLPAQRDGHPDQSIGSMEIRLITPDYFRVMGIPLLQGRSFSQNDTSGSPAVALVNGALARTWWGRAGALGDRVIIGRFRGRDYPDIMDSSREVIGVAANTKNATLQGPVRPTIYVPLAQARDVFPGMTGKLAWVLSVQDSSGMAAEVRRTVAGEDSTLQVRRLRPFHEIVSSSTAGTRFDASLFGTFAALALLLAAIGVYGVLSFSVEYRRQEI
ncbi:MAG TPA: ADOP family duplicated permease, partial [Candidatus Angelobacter sp.]|nr:ADOP family duplicated permease [Candidatus Angelobacter sp.]